MIRRISDALGLLDRPPRVLRALMAIVITVTVGALLEVHRLPATLAPDALGARLFHRTFGALHLIALGLGALFASAAVTRVRRDGLLDHLHLAGATGASIALTLFLRSTARAAACTALASPMVALGLYYADLPVSLLASALSSALACAALGAAVGVALSAAGDERSATARASLTVAVIALVGYRVLGHDAAAIALAPLHASPRGTLWWIELLTDGRASPAMRRVGVVAPWCALLATTPWLLGLSAPGLSPDGARVRRPWIATVVATALLALPMAVAVHAVSRPLDRIAWLHAALVAWTSLALVLLDGELSLAILLLGTAALGLAGAARLPAVRGFGDAAVVSAAVAGNVLVLASLVSALARRSSPRLTALFTVAALCAVPRVVRELAGSYGASPGFDAFAALSPLAALELIARDVRSTVGPAWRESTRSGLITVNTLVIAVGAPAVVLARYLRMRANREIVR